MKAIIKKNYKKIGLAIAAMLLAFTFIFSDEVLAIVLPSAADLQLISYELSDIEFEYTGEEMKPEVIEIKLQNGKGKEVVKTGEEITVVSYYNNTEFGKGDIEVKLKGYSETKLLEDVFQIIPAPVEEVTVEQVTEEYITLSWKEVAGAEGYQIFRKEKGEDEFVLLVETTDGTIATYQDTDITYNKIYEYEVCAYGSVMEEEILFGGFSQIVTVYTPLTTPVISEVSPKNYNSILVQWDAVDGAIGYQVFRGESSDGEYTMVAEITDASQTSFKDTSCECGKEYFYYVTACQQLETETTYGEASDVESSKTKPNKVKIAGKTTETYTKVTLTWKKSEGAQGYQVYRKEGSSDYKLVKKIDSADTLTWKDSGLTQGKEYTYRIRPYCVVDEKTVTGSYSNTYVKKSYVAPVISTPSTGNSNGGGSNTGESSTGGTVSGSISGVTKYVGVPYVYGGETTSGWDCSGFTKWVMKNYFGINLSHSAAAQAGGGRSVDKSSRSSWQAGDLIFFSNGSSISHVGLYLGNGKMMHALNKKYGTIIQGVDYYENWDSGNYLSCVRRYH